MLYISAFILFLLFSASFSARLLNEWRHRQADYVCIVTLPAVRPSFRLWLENAAFPASTSPRTEIERQGKSDAVKTMF